MTETNKTPAAPNAEALAYCRLAEIPAECADLGESVALWDSATGMYWAMTPADAKDLAARVIAGERYSEIMTDYPAEQIGAWLGV